MLVYNYSQLLTSGYSSQIGLAKSLNVSPGDVIRFEAYAKYRNLDNNTNADLNTFAASLLGAFQLTPGAPGDPGLAYNALEDYGTIIAGGHDHSEYQNVPKAYLNILLFDKKYNFVDAAYKQIIGAEQVGTTVNTPHDPLMLEVTVTEPGYAYVFLSNENLKRVDVHFDDVMITQTHSTIVAGSDYYPFGLAMENREITDEPYRYGYQGQFSEKDLATGMQEFELRMYDPRIGRWISPDPYRGVFDTPYSGMANQPHMLTDPDGGCPCPWLDGGILLREVVVTGARITANALPVIASVVGRNAAGGQVFMGTDGGLYSAVPKITGTQYYQAIDEQWQLVHDEGAMRERYAQQLLDLHRVLADINGALITSGLGSGQRVVRNTAPRVALNVTKEVSAEGAVWAQKTFSNTFSETGRFAGQTVDEVASALGNGALKATEVPIDVVVRDGKTFILNTRSSAALTKAGIPRSSWNVVDRTGQTAYENMLTGQLTRNGLGVHGINTIRQSGTNFLISN